ncbi:MAG: T9SS type A sorting domain-containing protein [Bacteroidia bacterium]
MKKIYVTLFLITVTFCSNAQLTLTKAFNEPVIGDLYVKAQFDTVGTIPKNTGAGQLWNYSTLTPVNFTETSTYTTVASVPNGSLFPGATLAENQGGTNYTMYKSTGSNFEVQGINNPGAAVNFSNTGIFAIWPIAFGYNNTDIASGSSTGSVISTINATVNVNAAGTGTIMLPGGVVINNVLQVIQTITVSQSTGTMSGTFVQKHYDYYSGSQKFPVLSLEYKTQGGFNAFINKNVVTGVASNEFKNEFNVYPNPVKDVLTISLNNNSNLPVSITLTNLVGQVVKAVSLGSESNINSLINVADLSKGVYLVNIKTGTSSSVKKVIID